MNLKEALSKGFAIVLWNEGSWASIRQHRGRLVGQWANEKGLENWTMKELETAMEQSEEPVWVYTCPPFFEPPDWLAWVLISVLLLTMILFLWFASRVYRDPSTVPVSSRVTPFLP